MPNALLGFDARTPYAVLDREHRALRQGLSQLRQALKPGEGVAPQDLRQQIDAVRRSLAAHFAFEENYGSLHYLMVTQPSLQSRLEQLHDEHRGILLEMDSVLARLGRGPAIADVEATISLLLDRLAEHVLEQQQLIRRALLGAQGPLPPHAVSAPPAARRAS
jgi:hemerythrin